MNHDEKTLFETLGGLKTIEILVHRFYELMDTLPEVKTIRDMHPLDLTDSASKLILFLQGWSGGPQTYIEKYGHPRLRARHLPFKIGQQERDQWLYCMYKALDECKEKGLIHEPTNTELKKSFAHIANFMRNVEETESSENS